MISRRSGLRIISVLTLLVLLGGYGYFSWLRLLEQHAIRQLEWQGLSLSLTGIDLAHLALQQHGNPGVAAVEAQRLHLDWRQFSLAPPFFQHIRLQRLAVTWQPAAQSSAVQPTSTELDRQQLAAALAWLPLSLRVDEVVAELPCASGRCSLQGDLQLTQQQTARRALQLQLNLQHREQQLAWRAQLQGDAQAAALQLSLAVDGQRQLSLHSSLRDSPAGPLWSGQLSAPDLSQAVTLQDWLSEWLLAPDARLPSAPSAARLTANWQLQLTTGSLNLEQLRRASGRFDASASLPQPWPIPGAGQVQGDFSVSARGVEGQWFAEGLEADLQLKQLPAEWLSALPLTLHPDALHLRIQPASPLSELPGNLAERSLPLALSLTSSGASQLELQARLALANAPPWAVQLDNAQLSVDSPGLAVDDWKLRDLQARLHFNGYLDTEQLRLDLSPDSQLELGELSTAELRLLQLGATSRDLQLHAQHQAGTLQAWHLHGSASLATQRLEQASLEPQGWRWQGTLAASPQRLELSGQVAADADLQLAVQLQHTSSKGLQLKAQLTEVFLRAGNPLAKILTDWPALLDLNNGRLSGDASLNLAPGRASPAIQLNLSGQGLAGIYDRSELSGLDARLQLRLDQRQLHLELSELRLEQVDPGIPIGPTLLRATYKAARAQPSRGLLELQQAQASVMGGTLWLNPGQWDLQQSSLVFPLHLQGLDLNQFFTLYPAEGLAGSGLIDGQLPLSISPAGVEIEQGQLLARAPGGRLEFHSERIRALGRSNPTMQLVTQSLENFHYTTLRSQVNYARQGKLQLAMRLEGRNPAIEQGYPIHFNINLEEDIPTLLASLQLTDKVNAIIKQRVQQRMLERNAASPKEP
ncbi:YdbH domain-containing protein [Pseudomonas sp. sp1636]|uniref:intermembrane phospholipid transport protein YdbH family protein n=1 Tax=Pseudomonas sp. sp1636 TaxID=3036707 RepID=UPI0025A55E10|nr:YdbH domain-containing protein [Pseudomonas sp. sp1636]MDM8350094.1 YdbH domain-containing protein [Pseudomonas sp. sp1636]